MFPDSVTVWLAISGALLNVTIALLFWLHEKLETRKTTKLRQAVEQAVRAVEQICDGLDSPQKKEQAIARVLAFLGLYRWLIPPLVIETAIDAELFVVRQLHTRLSVDHDTAEEVNEHENRD